MFPIKSKKKCHSFPLIFHIFPIVFPHFPSLPAMFTGQRPQWVSPASVAPPAEPWAPTEGDGVALIQLERMGEECYDYEIFIEYVWDIHGIFIPEMEIMLWLWNMYGIFMVYLSLRYGNNAMIMRYLLNMYGIFMVYLSLRDGNNAMILEYVWDIHGIFIPEIWK